MVRLHRSSRLVAAVAIGSFACGGDGGDPPSGPSVPPPGMPMYSVSGTVYRRSDLIAYPIDGTSDPLLAGVSLGFGNANTTSAASGSFSISTSAQLNGADFLPVKATLAGYQPGGMPSLMDERGRSVPVGLYPETAVAPRPGFVKGIEFFDAGGGLAAAYASGQHAKVMDRVRDQDGANLVMTI